ncbi:MAG TPA: efflux RND transporter periplasmic adaptor subunit [Vicinamibacterales bacterium]
MIGTARLWTIAVLLAVSPLAAASCSRPSADTPPNAASTPSRPPAGLFVDPKMRASITVAAVQPRDVAAVLSVAGKVQFDEDRLSRVIVPVAGQVVDLRVKLGDGVKRGQPLCAINSREAAGAVGEHAESHKDLELAEKNAAMTQDLFDHQAASKMSLQQALNDLAKARARVARNDAALQLLGLRNESDMASFTGRVPVVSPITGTVIERKVTDGQFVQSDSTPIITVADLSAVWIVGDLFERDLRLVKIGAPATVTTAAYAGEPFRGRVSYISDSIDPATRAAKVRVAAANPGGRLKPEMFATVSLDLPEVERAITVPASAVFVDEGRSFVYVDAGGGRFERRVIEVADTPGADRRVLSGLRAGERVVVDGALLLRQEEDKKAG